MSWMTGAGITITKSGTIRRLQRKSIRTLATQLVNYQGREVSLCSYFPGYNYCEPELSDDHVDDMIAMLGAMDRLFNGV